jgi:hypothetical protein
MQHYDVFIHTIKFMQMIRFQRWNQTLVSSYSIHNLYFEMYKSKRHQGPVEVHSIGKERRTHIDCIPGSTPFLKPDQTDRLTL